MPPWPPDKNIPEKRCTKTVYYMAMPMSFLNFGLGPVLRPLFLSVTMETLVLCDVV